MTFSTLESRAPYGCVKQTVYKLRGAAVTVGRAAEDVAFLYVCVLLVQQVFDKLIILPASLPSLWS